MGGRTHCGIQGLGIVHMGVEQHSCVIVRCLQRDGQSIAAILQTAEERGGQTESQEVREGKSEFTDLLGHKRECPPRTESFTV